MKKYQLGALLQASAGCQGELATTCHCVRVYQGATGNVCWSQFFSDTAELIVIMRYCYQIFLLAFSGLYLTIVFHLFVCCVGICLGEVLLWKHVALCTLRVTLHVVNRVGQLKATFQKH